MYVQQQIQQPCLKTYDSTNSTFHDIRQCFNNLSSTSFETSLFNHFFKVPSSFGGEAAPPPPPPPKASVTASKIVEIVIERAVSTDIIVIPCSRNKVRILCAKNVS